MDERMWHVDGSEPWDVQADDGEYIARFSDATLTTSNDMKRAARVVAEHNFLLGIPTARLTTADPAALMLLAWLRGAEEEAATYADEVIVRATLGPGYVSRAELEERNKFLVYAVERLKAEAEEMGANAALGALTRSMLGQS